jgi:PST family polysaccharide transporter
MQDIRGRLARGALWIAVARILVSLIGVGSTLLLARLLTPGDFGLVAIATTISAIVGSVTELSLASALVQHRAPEEEHFHTAFTLNGLRAVIIAVALCLAAGPIAGVYGDPRLGPVMVVVALTGLAYGFTNPKLVLMTRELVFWQDFVVNVSQKLAGFLIAAAIALAFRSYWALILGSAAAQVLALILSYVIRPYRPRLGWARARELFSFSVWLTLGQGVNTLNWNLDKLVAGYVYGPSLLGTYTVGDNLAVLPTREVTAPIAHTLFPGFARMADDPARLRHAYLRAQGLLCAIAFPVGIGFAAVAHLVVPLALGPQWTGAVFVIQMVATVNGLQALTTPMQPLAMALGETRLLFMRDLVGLLIRLPAIAVGMALAGFPGILYGRAAAALIGGLMNMHLAWRLTGLSIFDQLASNARTLAASLVMVGSIVALEARLAPGALGPGATLALACAVGAASFVAASGLLWLLARRPEGPERELAGALAWAVGRAAPLVTAWRTPR